MYTCNHFLTTSEAILKNHLSQFDFTGILIPLKSNQSKLECLFFSVFGYIYLFMTKLCINI